MGYMAVELTANPVIGRRHRGIYAHQAFPMKINRQVCVYVEAWCPSLVVERETKGKPEIHCGGTPM